MRKSQRHNPYWGSKESFADWFSGSAISERGKPIPVYHGTQAAPFKEFSFDKAKADHGGYLRHKVFSFSFDRAFAERYAGFHGYGNKHTLDSLRHHPHGRVLTCYLRVFDPFDFRDRAHVREKLEAYAKSKEEWLRTDALWLKPGNKYAEGHNVTAENREQRIAEELEQDIAHEKELIESGDWASVEHVDWLKKMGHDAVYMMEKGSLNISVLSDAQIWVEAIHWNNGKTEGYEGDPLERETNELLEMEISR